MRGKPMSRISAASCALTIVFMGVYLPSAIGQTAEEYCSASNNQTEYFSDTFTIPRFPNKTALRQMKADYVEFVKTKYSVNDVVGSCGADKAAAETNAKSQNRKIVETGWK